MNHRLIIEPTPNPNAKKIILDMEVINDGKKVTYHSAEECQNNELAAALFNISFISALHFFENVITITTSDEWDEELIKGTIIENIDDHDPHTAFAIQSSRPQTPEAMTADMNKINEILDKTIRPGLIMDGGDLTVVKFEGSNLYIRYEGACGGCPSAQYGTLQAIQDILRSQVDKNIEVIAV